MTTSSGLGPANGSVTMVGLDALYGSVKRLSGCCREEGWEVLLNMVLAKAEGSAWSSGGVSMGSSWLLCVGFRSMGVGIFS
jgi:hypothetical protein